MNSADWLLLAQTATSAPNQATDSGNRLADIREPVQIIDWTTWGLVIGAVAILALIVLWIILRLRRRGPKVELGPPPPPPGVWAQTELDRIAREGDTLEDRIYVAAVSDVVRGYLERALKLPAPERTTEEFLQEITRHPVFSPEMRSEMGRFLERCDLVKFARQELEREQRPVLISQARSFVETTEASQTTASQDVAPSEAASA
jgi:hypothetical protein